MVATITVLYPREEGAKFDIDHYMNEFIPMCKEKYKPYGLISWRVTEFQGVVHTEGGLHETEDPPYAIQSTLVFDTKDGLQKAVDEAAKEIISHIDKHSSHIPLMMTTHDVGSVTM